MFVNDEFIDSYNKEIKDCNNEELYYAILQFTPYDSR